jgi:catechol-2,3-dioxygenase
MPSLHGILETVLYVDSFERACPFYEQVLGLNSVYRDQRLCAYDVGGRGLLLLFLRGQSLETVHMPGGTIPPHDGSGPVHIAFSIGADALAAWEKELAEADVAIEAAPHGRAAASAFISAIPTIISSNWRRRDYGRAIRTCRRPTRWRRG